MCVPHSVTLASNKYIKKECTDFKLLEMVAKIYLKYRKVIESVHQEISSSARKVGKMKES